ncbi:MAG: choice-of-anchor Q domain-containing protein, partial [Verrucomicrobiia bacterium]
PTQTMPPEPGSPALGAGDWAAASQFTTDQRGFPRAVSDNVDIGSVEIQPGQAYCIVVNAANSGPGSLRQVVSNAPPNATITFDPGLSGQIITLDSGQIVLSSNLTIDASGLPYGLVINGHHASRIFTINNGATVNLVSLVLYNGYATNSYGGAVSNGPSSTAVIVNCLVISNSADIYGGGIVNNGIIYLNNSTLAGNHAGEFGGGLNNDGSVVFKQCTFTGNSALTGGGALSSGGAVNLIQSTLTGNSTSGFAGGIHSGGAGTLSISNSIVAGNNAANKPDLDSAYTGVTNLIGGTAQLAALGYYGGPTPTMPPLPGSPVIAAGNAGIATGLGNDQRGFPRIVGGQTDLGAVELQSPPANPPVLENAVWYGGGGGAGAFQFTMSSAPGADFTVLSATNVALPLTNWTVLGEVMQPLPGQYQFVDPGATNAVRFYRVRSP